MSQAVTSLSSEKPSQGILRIFRQSVRELGCLTKTDAVAFRKESVDSQHKELIDKKNKVDKESAVLLNKKCFDRQITDKESCKEDSVNERDSNNNEESILKKVLKSGTTGEDSSYRKGRGNPYLQQNESKYKPKEKRRVKGPADFKHNILVFNGKGENLLKSNATVPEDWDKELQKDSERNIQLDVASDETAKIYNLQKECTGGFETLCRNCNQIDLNNNFIAFKNANVNKEKVENVTSVSHQDHFKAETEPEQTKANCIDENYNPVVNVEEKAVDNLLEKFDYSWGKKEEFISKNQFSPFHSSPKKNHRCNGEEVDKKLNADKVNACSAQVIDEEAETGVKTNKVCISEQVAKISPNSKIEYSPKSDISMKKQKYSTRSSDSDRKSGRFEQNHNFQSGSSKNFSRFEKPPRFNSAFDKIGNKDQADNILEGVHELQQCRNTFPRPDVRRRGSEKFSVHDNRSNNYSRGSDRGRGELDHRRHFKPKDHLDRNDDRAPLLELKIKTPAKFKTKWNGYKAKEYSDESKAGHQWKVPFLEDWSNEIQDLEPAKDVSGAYEIQDLEPAKDALNVNGDDKIMNKLAGGSNEQYMMSEIEYNEEMVQKEMTTSSRGEQYVMNKIEYNEDMVQKEMTTSSRGEQYVMNKIEYNKEMVQKEMTTSSRGEIELGYKTEESDNNRELYLPPPPPGCLSRKNILDEEESSLKKSITIEENSFPKNDEVARSSLSDHQKHVLSLKLNVDGCNSKRPKPYLPPVPLEVIESGDEISWTNANYGDSKIPVTSCWEGKKDDEQIASKADVPIYSPDDNSDYEIVSCDQNDQNCSGNFSLPVKLGIIDSKCIESAPAIVIEKTADVQDVVCMDRKVVADDSSSLSSIYARKDGAYVFAGHGNMTSEADVSDLPFDESRAWENEGSSGFCVAKSVDNGAKIGVAITNTDGEQLDHEINRKAYEDYARYWYEQYTMNTDHFQSGEFGPWHSNYPYNYEAYQRWCEQIQMNYYWEMYYRQSHEQMSHYWYTQPYSCPPTNNFNQNEGNNVENHVSGTVEKAETNKTVNRKERKTSGQSVNQGNTDQCSRHGNDLENAEGVSLPQYRSERVHQWVKNQSQDATDKYLVTETPSEYCSDRNKQDLVSVELTENVCSGTVDTERKKAETVQNTSFSCSEKIDHSKEMRRGKSDPKFQDKVDKDSKIENACSCKPSKVAFMVWRTCNCDAGNPPKLHKILSNTEERSLDLGYQSYESLEQEEAAVSKQEASKAPGFVIQPLCSIRPSQSGNIELSNQGCKERLCRNADEKLARNCDKAPPLPPPGFEKVSANTTHTENKTDMDSTSQHKRSHQDTYIRGQRLHSPSQFDNSFQQKTRQPSLKSLIEEQKQMFGAESRDFSDDKSDISTKYRQNMFTNVNNNNLTHQDLNNNKYSVLPRCCGKEARHLSNASLALNTAERMHENLNVITKLKTAVDEKITEMKNQQTILEYGSMEGFERLNEDQGTVKGDQNTPHESRINDASSIEKVSLRSAYRGRGRGLGKFEEEGRKMMRGIDQMSNCVLENLHTERSTKVKDDEEAIVADQCLLSTKQETSSDNYSDSTSGDEIIKCAVLSQSPETSDNEQLNARTGKIKDYGGDLKVHKSDYDTRTRNEMYVDNENTKIPVNEIMEDDRYAGNIETNSKEFFKMESPRFTYRPRSPYSSFLPPYRGGTCRLPFRPFSHMDQWPVDPRFLSMPPRPPFQWPPPSAVSQMYSPEFAYGPKAAWDTLHRPVYDATFADSRMFQEQNAQNQLRFPPPMHRIPTNRDGFTNSTNDPVCDGRKEVPQLSVERHCQKLVEYGTSDDSSSEIEPFDVNMLYKPERKPGSQLRHTPKKLKTDTEDDSSSLDSFEIHQKDNRSKVHGKTTAAVKLSRGHSKKLKQKSLKSFSATERQFHGLKTSNEPSYKQETKKKTLAAIIAETTGRPSNFEVKGAGDQVDYIAQEFPSLGSEQEKQLPPLPPLPPFPNSPFWSMYSPGNSSALTGKCKEDEYTKAKSENSTALQPQRKWLHRTPSKRYSFSPGQAAGFNSPSETDSETLSIRNDWKTNFKIFHNFGVKYIDTHCHLDFLFSREGFKGSFRAYMDKHAETFPDTFEGCVAVFCNPNTFTPSGGLWLDVAKEPNVWIAMGCHPKMATDFTAAAELGLKKCLRHSKCIALGEIGLDYSGTFYQHVEVQKDVFRRQLKMALDLEKVLVIHCRQAEEDCLEIMKEMVPRNWKIHCHCFTNEYKNAKLWIDAFPNLFIGVTPLVTYRTAKPTHDLARNIPITKLLLETDAPYFIPRCIPKDDLPLSNPGLAVTVAKEIAQYQELTVAAVLRQCRMNTKFMYGI